MISFFSHFPRKLCLGEASYCVQGKLNRRMQCGGNGIVERTTAIKIWKDLKVNYNTLLQGLMTIMSLWALWLAVAGLRVGKHIRIVVNESHKDHNVMTHVLLYLEILKQEHTKCFNIFWLQPCLVSHALVRLSIAITSKRLFVVPFKT